MKNPGICRNFRQSTPLSTGVDEFFCVYAVDNEAIA
jgi:hypothetical protein